MNPKAANPKIGEKKDSESLVPSNPFDEFNNNLSGNDNTVVAGKKVPPTKKDSKTMGEQPAVPNTFEEYNQTLKKKDISGNGVSALDPAVSQEASISLSSGDPIKAVKEVENVKQGYTDATAYLQQDLAANTPNAQKNIYPAVMGPDGQPIPQQDPNKIPFATQVMQDPKKLSTYLNDRTTTLSDQIKSLDAKKRGLVRYDQNFTGPGMSSTSQTITDPGQYHKLEGEITNLTNNLKELQKSAVEVVSNQLVEKAITANKHSIGVPYELGRDIVRYADKKTNDQYTALEDTGAGLPGVVSADLEQAGLSAWKKYLLVNPDVPERDARIEDVNKKSASFDERNFELTGARVKHKIGAELQKDAGFLSSIFRRQPTQKQIIEAANKAGLTPSEMKVFQTYVLPLEKRNIGTDIPMSGFFNKVGEAISSNVESLGNVVRSDNDRLSEALNQEANTRYDEVGEFQRDQGELHQLQTKAKSKTGITKDEQKRINELSSYNDVRRWYDKFWDGAGDLTGQVAYQAGLARLFGGIGGLATKAPIVGGLISRGTTLVGGADNVNLMVTSFLTSYDSHAKEAVLLMPTKDQALQRRLYAYTMSGIEGLSERIFPDTKVLDAFKKTVSPDVVKMSARLAAGEISEEAAKSRLQSLLTNKLKPFAKEFAKGEFQESTEEGVVDIATGISETIFAGKDFNAEQTFGNAANTFLTTMAYSPFVSGLAAHKDVRAGAYGKSGIYKMATDPETYRREVFRLQQEGMPQAEVDEKMKIINTAAEIARQLPVKKSLDPKKNSELDGLNSQWKKNIQAISEKTDITEAEKETLKQAEDTRSGKEIADYVKKQNQVNNAALDYPDRATYLTHRLNEVLLDKQIATTTDDVVKADLIKQKDRSQKIREGIFNGDIIVGNHLEEIAHDPKLADELGITSLENADEDSLPINISKPKIEKDEKAGSTTQRQQAGEKSEVSEHVGEQNQAGEQTLPAQQDESLTEPVIPAEEGRPTLPPGMTENQFKKLSKKTQEKLLAQQKTKGGTNAVQEQTAAEGVLRNEGVQGEGGLQEVEPGNQPKEVSTEEKEVIDAVRDHPGAPDYIKDILDANPKEVIKTIQDQVTGKLGDGSQRSQVLEDQAIKMFGKDAVDKAKALLPKQEEKVRGTPTDQANVTYEPIKDLTTDTKRFQPRAAEFSQESVNKIVDNYDDNKLDPVVVYPDENGDQIILAGHSRLEAHKQLTELPDSDPRKKAAIEKGFKPGKIKTRYFNGTEAEAREFADRSNDLGTKNKDYESAASLRRSRQEGQTKKAIQDRAKSDFGKNWRYMYNMSYLNPTGKAIQTLQQFENNPDKEGQNKIEKAVQWIGAVRDRLGDEITNAHENEMFDYLMDKNRSTKLERENDFINLIQNITGKFDFNPNEPLNLNRIKNKTQAEVNHDSEESEIKQAIREKQHELDSLNDRLNNPQNAAYVNPNSPDYADVQRVADQRKVISNQQLQLLRKELVDHQQNKGKTISTGMAQPGLFDVNNLAPGEKEELNNELTEDGITVDKIANYEQENQSDISDTAAVQPQDNGNAEETATIPENVRRSANEPGAGTQQNPVGAAVQGQQRTSPAVTLTPEQLATYNSAKDLLPQINIEMKVADKLLWQASAHASVLIDGINSGKNPNGKKIDVADTLKQLQADVDKMTSAIGNQVKQTDRKSSPVVKKMANELAALLGKAPLALNLANAKERLTFKDIGIVVGDTKDQIMDKLIAYPSEFSDMLAYIRADANFKNVNIELSDSRAGLENGESGLYHPQGFGQGKDMLLQISNKDNALYTAVHELQHFFTLDSAAAENVKGTQAYHAIEDFYNYIVSKKGKPVAVAGQTNLENYGLTDVKEFMAELLINPAFREYVGDVFATNQADIVKTSKNIRDAKITSIGDLILNFFKSLFTKAMGLGVEYNENKSVIENAAELARNLFFDQQNLTPEGRVVAMPQVQEEQKKAALALPSFNSDKDLSKIMASFVADKKNEGADPLDIKEALMMNGVSQEDANAMVDAGAAPVISEKDLFLQQKQQKLADAKQAFRDSLRKQRGQANISIIPIDPEVIANGVKLMAAYADLGLYKFKQIVQDIADTFGPEYVDKQNIDALKGVYSYYRSNLTKDERAAFDNEDAVDNFIDNDLKINDGTSTTSDLESDSTRGTAANGLRQAIVPATGTRSDKEAGTNGESVVNRVQPADSPSLFPLDAATVRETSDSGLPIDEQLTGLVTSPTRAAIPGGGSSANESGVSSNAGTGESVEGNAGSLAGSTIAEKIAAQKAAESIAVINGDLDNIRATLPFLMPGQHQDVYKAERRFFGDAEDPDKLYGKGMMFTNGTGTGKTLTGLGVIKRFMKSGKNNILVVVPSDVKAKDWITESQDFMQMPMHQLESTQDRGKDLNVTTYANFRENPSIQNRQWDLVVYDESHKINSNGQGINTAGEDAHNTATSSPRIARRKAMVAINYNERLSEISDRNSRAREQGQPVDYNSSKLLDQELQEATIKEFKKTNVVFLSATPFSYHPNLTYADGYLFKIREDFQEKNGPTGYNQPNAYNNFYIQNFGYRMLYNRLTKPESGVDMDLLERQFTEGLKTNGVVVSRKLDVDKDYSRQFVVVDNQLGSKIDEGVNLMSDYEKYPNLAMNLHRQFTFLYKNQLMEAIKAKWAVDRIQQHLDLGRKVVVSHTYIENEPRHPFRFSAGDILSPNDKNYGRVRDELEAFHEENPEYQNLDMSGLKAPIQTIVEAFGNRVALFNGQESKKDRNDAKRNFNDDNKNVDIFVVQMDAGKEGTSLHDRTGKKQRSLINLGLPYKPTDAIQIEGRIYRTGQKTDAVIEYPILNLNFERFAYANKINERVRTAENLALGEEARNLETSFKEGYLNATDERAHADQGKGGKQEDARMDSTGEFQKSLTYYYKRGKRTSADKRNVSGDYYATPEPLGLKMVQWTDLVPNEKFLEPSAGHGAIARFASRATKNVFIEPNADLRSETSLNAHGETKAGNFEDLNIINKFDGIVMNPPFGRGGKLAMDHLVKAMGHLNDGGRITALVPTGQMNDRIADWEDSPASKGFYIQAKIQLPNATFERAGTKVGTQILVIDKVMDDNAAKNLPPQRNIDLTNYDTTKELFDAIENLSLPGRINPGQYAEEGPATETTGAENAAGDGTPVGENDLAEVIKNFHQKLQLENFVVKLKKQVSENEFSTLKSTAKEMGGYYSNFKGAGAIPGFQFETQAAANNMLQAITGKNIPGAEKMSLADRVRTWKISKTGQQLYSTIIPGGPQIWNAAVEIAATAIEAGEAMVDALQKGRNYIEQNWKKSWQKAKYNEEMISELKGRGVLKYDLTDDQRGEADAAISRIQRTGKLIKEINDLREAFDIAKTQLMDPADIQELEDSYNEFERYLFDGLSAQQIESLENFSLDLKDQTWWQKAKENWQNRYQRLEQIQKEIEAAGLTIDEKNDMVNRADRWKSIAAAKIDNILREIGLSDVDVFIWKGRQKLDDSLFDRMAKDGVDYRKFNLYMYARHAPERNAHNAKVRRETFAKKIAQIENDIQKHKDEYLVSPTPTTKGLITRKENELAAYEAYEAAYNDPTTNKNYLNLLEKKIDLKFKLMDNGGSGMTNEQAEEILKEVDTEGVRPKFEAYETAIREKVIAKSLDLQKEYGLIDDENYEYLKNYYQNYVPLKVDDSFFENNQTYAGSNIPGAKIYKSKGASNYTFENRSNPLTQAVIDLQATIYEGEQNQYKQVIAETVKTAPDKEIWELKSATYAPVKDKQGKVVGLDEITQPPNGIPYFDNGQKKYLVINDKALFEALQGTNVKAAIPILAKVNGIFRSLYTLYNPAFTVSNLFRDMETAGVVLSATQKNEAASNFRGNVKRIFKIIRASYKQQGGAENTYWEKLAQQYKDNGGEMSWFRQDTAEAQIEDIEEAYKKYEKSGAMEAGKNLGLKLADFVNRANQAVENSTRLAIYDAVLKSGIAPYKAIEIARNATINFNKKGNYSGLVDSMYLFFNASVQGTANVMKTMLTTKAGLKLAGGIAMTGMLLAIYNNLMSDCDDPQNAANCYGNIPDYEKERSIVIKIPGGKGFLKIPLAWGFNVFFNMGEQAGQGIMGKTDVSHASSFIFKSALNSFNPTGGVDQPLLQHISPTVTDPIVQYFTNKDGFGRPIYNDYPYDKRPDSQKGFGSDSQGSKNLAEWLNKTTGGNEKLKGKMDISPGTLDWLFETFTGGMGQFTSQTIGSTRDAIDPKQEVDIKKVPIVNRFYTAPKERSDRALIFNSLDDSYNSIMSGADVDAFKKELQKAVRLGEISPDKATKYERTVTKNQLQLNNPQTFDFIEQTKTQKVSPEEIENFINELEQRADSGEMPRAWIKTYKAQITKNQKKFKEDE